MAQKTKLGKLQMNKKTMNKIIIHLISILIISALLFVFIKYVFEIEYVIEFDCEYEKFDYERNSDINRDGKVDAQDLSILLYWADK